MDWKNQVPVIGSKSPLQMTLHLYLYSEKRQNRRGLFQRENGLSDIYNRILTKEEINLLAANPCFKPDCSVEKVSANFSFDISNCNNANFKLQGHNHRLFSDVNGFLVMAANRQKNPQSTFTKSPERTPSALSPPVKMVASTHSADRSILSS